MKKLEWKENKQEAIQKGRTAEMVRSSGAAAESWHLVWRWTS